MEEPQTKIKNMRDRTNSVLSELIQLEDNIQPEKREEGTVKARLKEAVGRMNQAKQKLENAANIARDE